MALQILDRLWSKTIIDEKTNCWIYTGSDDGRKKYGKIRFNGKKERVNRVSCHLFHGLELKDNTLQALHKQCCPNKKCWNPEHLYIGTRKDNARDALELDKYRNRKTGSQRHWRKNV